MTAGTAAEARDRQDRAWLLQLVKEFQDIVAYYRLRLTQPFIRFDESEHQLGSWNAYTRTLTLSRRLITQFSWDAVLEIFKHELAHMWVSDQGRDQEEPHGLVFQEACRRLGVAPWARTATVEINPDTARSAHRGLSEEKERQIRRVEKLLSLAQSSNPNEAALAMERARELSVQYQIDRRMEERHYTYILISHQKKTMPAHQNAIASILCTHFYVDCVSRSQYDAKASEHYKVLEVLGSVENVQIAEYVYWYLWRELKGLWKHYQAETAGKKSRSSQRSFYLGVLNGFHRKLSLEKAAESSAAPVASAAGTELMTMDKGLERQLRSELRSFVGERYPRLNRGSGSRAGVERDAYASGVARGETLSIRQGLRDNSSRQLALTGRTS